MTQRRTRRQRHLTFEDRALWRHVTADVKPLDDDGRKGGQQPGRSPGDGDADEVRSQEPQPGVGSHATSGARTPPPHPGGVTRRDARRAHPARAAEQRQTSPLPPHTDIDPRTRRRIERGREDIDARLDLHGMRQEEAHRALRSFLMRCAADGRRNVLIITGKGTTQRNGEPAHVQAWDTDLMRAEPGVLRRNVPIWLQQPDMRRLVVGFSQAHVKHGGAGAIYVRLRVKSPRG